MSDVTVVSSDSTPESSDTVVVPVAPAPPNHDDVAQFQVELLRTIKDQVERSNRQHDEKIAEICGKIELLEGRLNDRSKPISEEVREQALDEIRDLGNTLGDLTEKIDPAPEVTIASSPASTVSTQDDGGSEGDTIVAPDVGGSPPANARRRRGGWWGGI